MAKNILPHQPSSENELVGLINWSVPWIAGLAVIFFLISLQWMISVIKTPDAVSRLCVGLLAIAFFLSFFNLLQLYRNGKRYVETELQTFLTQIFVRLGLFWTLLSIAVVLSGLLPVLGKIGPTVDTSIFSLVAPSVLVAGTLLVSAIDKKKTNSLSSFSTHILEFAKRSVARTRIVTALTYLVGLGLIGFYFLRDDTTSLSIGTLISGIALVSLGVGFSLSRKSLLDIRRNPSPINLERALEKLNLFWLVACVSFFLQFIANFA